MPTDKSSHIVTVLLTLHDVQPSHGGVGFGPMSWRPTMRAEAHETPVSHTLPSAEPVSKDGPWEPAYQVLVPKARRVVKEASLSLP